MYSGRLSVYEWLGPTPRNDRRPPLARPVPVLGARRILSPSCVSLILTRAMLARQVLSASQRGTSSASSGCV